MALSGQEIWRWKTCCRKPLSELSLPQMSPSELQASVSTLQLSPSELQTRVDGESQFISRDFAENKTHFLHKYQCESWESHKSREKGKMRYIVKLAILAICETHKQSKS
jgi:hypothetical protein